jgi:hypothetical protein
MIENQKPGWRTQASEQTRFRIIYIVIKMIFAATLITP